MIDLVDVIETCKNCTKILMDVNGTSNWEETSGKTKDFIPFTGLGTPGNAPVRGGWREQEVKSQIPFHGTAAPVTSIFVLASNHMILIMLCE